VSLQRLLNHRDIGRALARLMPCEETPDLVLCSQPIPEACEAAVRYGHERGCPVIVDIRDLWPDSLLDLLPSWARVAARLATWPMERQLRRICRGAAAVIAPNDRFVDWGLRYAGRPRGPLDRAFPLAYPAIHLDAESRKRGLAFWRAQGLSPGSGDLLVCFFGTISHQFDLDTVLETASVLRGSKTGVRFVLCGAGDSLDRYRRACAPWPDILLPGWVGTTEIWTLMEMADIGLAPYKATPPFLSNVPNKVIEYLCAGLPVISTLGDGVVGELTRETGCGRLYDAGNAGELATILTDLSGRRDLCDEMSGRARSLFERRFSAEKTLAAMAGYLEEAATAGRGSAAVSR
jgi:glycosyltransferase involved in cell wall biosynthesis